MKFQRQAKILELIDRFEIETQEELTDHLRAVGYSTTQATVSRDIKELRLIKSLSTETGKYKYTAAAAGAADSFTTRLRNIFRECVTDIDAAQNMVVIKTLPGLGQAAAMGDHHLRISKSVRDGRSFTDVSPMDRAHRIDEIARLLSGEEISDAARKNAEDLLDAAGQGA